MLHHVCITDIINLQFWKLFFSAGSSQVEGSELIMGDLMIGNLERLPDLSGSA